VNLRPRNGVSCENMPICLTRFDERLANLAINGGLKMKYAREFVVNAVVGGLLVLLPIYLAVLVLLKGMQSVVGLLRPIAALGPRLAAG
jgi:cadmium resistance protein CadD (predicted permease)